MRHGIQALAVLLFFLATLTLFSGRPRATSTWGERVAELELQVAELLVESNAQPVLLDANDVEVGTVVAIANNGVSNVVNVMFDIEGAPLFILQAAGDEFLQSGHPLLFTNSDCSGPGYIRKYEIKDPVIPNVFYLTTTGETWVATTREPEPITYAAQQSPDGSCIATTSQEEAYPAMPVPEMIGAFTPPFEVVTRGDLLAQ